MPIIYRKLFALLEERGRGAEYDLRKKGISPSILDKLKRGTGGIDHRTIEKLCKYLGVQPGDIMEYVEEVQKLGKINKINTDAEKPEDERTKHGANKILEPREIEPPAEFAPGHLFQLNANFDHGYCCGTVYRIDIVSKNMIGSCKMRKGFKSVCKGQTQINNFDAKPEQFKAWIEERAIIFVELVETMEAKADADKQV